MHKHQLRLVKPQPPQRPAKVIALEARRAARLERIPANHPQPPRAA